MPQFLQELGEQGDDAQRQPDIERKQQPAAAEQIVLDEVFHPNIPRKWYVSVRADCGTPASGLQCSTADAASG
ncbi:hypothetical protein GCM10009099_26570 [Caenispirillum bisanense]